VLAQEYEAHLRTVLAAAAMGSFPPPGATEHDILTRGRALAEMVRAAIARVEPPAESRPRHERVLTVLAALASSFPERDGWHRQNDLGREWGAILAELGYPASAGGAQPADDMTVVPPLMATGDERLRQLLVEMGHPDPDEALRRLHEAGGSPDP
jgi:hypothetical protein